MKGRASKRIVGAVSDPKDQSAITHGATVRERRSIVKRIPAFRLWLVGVLLVKAFIPGASAATTLTYPGDAPCDGTLQACIDAAGVGDTVEIATSDPIDESPELRDSLTLRAAPGFSPVLAAGNQVLAASGGSADTAYTIEGITLELGVIRIAHGSTGTLIVEILRNRILEGFSTFPAIGLQVGNVGEFVRGDVFLSIVDNSLTVPEEEFLGPDGIRIIPGNNRVTEGTIRGNTIMMRGCPECAAIRAVSLTGTVKMDVLDNHIAGVGYNNGIFLRRSTGEGTLDVRVINNAVTGQSGNVGSPGAIVVTGSGGTTNLAVISNTVSGNEKGIVIDGRSEPGVVMSGHVANNIVANSNQAGITIQSSSQFQILNSSNLVFANASDLFDPGPGTVTEEPRFAGPGDFRLRPGSPAIDAGSDFRMPADITLDIEGAPRFVGAAVDIGAYETQSVCGDGVVEDLEECDDGVANGAASSCCSTVCEALLDQAPCDDGDACTSRDVCRAATCRSGGPTLLDPVADLDQTIQCVLSLAAQRGQSPAGTAGVRSMARMEHRSAARPRTSLRPWGSPVSSTPIGRCS